MNSKSRALSLSKHLSERSKELSYLNGLEYVHAYLLGLGIFSKIFNVGIKVKCWTIVIYE